MSIEKEIFEFVKSMGDGLYKRAHIIDFNKNGFFAETQFRVYHSDGICLDVNKKLPDEDTDERDIEDGFVYEVMSDFEGFSKIDDENILRVLKRTFKLS